MTKEQTSAVPEELYNLTQLAEVTLAAGRLSTTNISEIKDYINATKNMPCDGVEMRSAKTDVSSEEEQQRRRTNMKAAVKREAVSSSPCADMWTPSVDVSPAKPEEFHNSSSDCANNCSAQSSAATSSNAAFYSSSDDDSNYYSHKVFDRRKLRRSTISDHSRYDEHSCSSSMPSCSGDEHCAGAASNDSGCNAGTHAHVSDSGGSSMGLLDDEHICPECGKKYSTSSNLARHRQTHRSIMDKKARRCPYCEKVYVSMPAFSMHVRTHNQGCECKYCGKCFSRPWLLQGHIRTHTGEKPFKCNVCNKAFADKSNLRAHIQTHSNTKPHTCTRCGKAFALKSYLYKHEESSCMKNHPRAEREIRAAGRTCATAQTSAISSKSRAQLSLSHGDSAKSTLATKLLQKERERRQAALSPYTKLSAQVTNTLVNPPAAQPAMRNSIGARTAADASLEQQQPQQSEKSYTMITSPMTQEDYERFKRISVIQPTALLQSQPPQPAAYADSASNANGNAVANLTLTAAPHFYSEQSHNRAQEQPVDFSPKNNFSHATKTSPFELTANYAMVA